MIDQSILLKNILVGITFIIIGIAVGRISFILLSRLIKKFTIKDKIRESFLGLLLTIIEWSIYIVFINLALNQLNLPLITNIVSKVIMVIPAITSALLLSATGIAIAFYIREIIEDSEITGWKITSMYFFYFILFIFGIYSIKIALVSIETIFADIIIVALTIIISSALSYYHIKKHREEDKN